MAVKIFVFIISQNFREIFNFVFLEIQNNFVKTLCFAKFVQCYFEATLCRSGG